MRARARFRWRSSGLLLAAALLWMLALVPAAQGAAGFNRLEFLAVSAGLDEPAAVMGAEGWQAFDGTLAMGYGAKPLWIRAWFDGHGGPREGDRYVRVGMPYLDDVRFYIQKPDGGWSEFRQGDRRAMQERDRRDRMFLFAAPEPREQPVLIRVSSTSTLSVSVDHLTEDELVQAALFEHVLLGGLIGLWALLLLWSASNAWVYRDAVSAWFSLYQLSAVLMGVGLSGYSALILPPDFMQVSELTSAAVLMSSVLALLFHRSLAAELSIPLRLVQVLDLALVMALLNPLLAFMGNERLALQTNAAMVVLVMGLYLPVTFLLALKPGQGPRAAVLLAYGALGMFVLFSMLPVLGLRNSGQLGLHATVLHSVLTGVLLGGVLFFRHARVVRESHSLELRAQASALENELIRAERDEKERLLSMLAHELRTPLSVIRMALESPWADEPAGTGNAQKRLRTHAYAAVRDMNEVIERTVQADRLERGAIRVEPVMCHVGEVMQLVAAEHGMLERLLITEDPDLPLIESDALLVKTVVANLVDNAIKYSPPGTPIQVRLAVDGSSTSVRGVLVSVSNAVGVAGRPDPSQAFQKYYRSDGAQRATGSGLGLFLVRGLTRRLGGGIHLAQTPVDEVCFELRLPLQLPS